MAAFTQILSQTRRHFLSKPSSHHHLSPLLCRFLSTAEPEPNQNPQSVSSQNPNRKPLPIQPVSYPTKPKQETQTESTSGQDSTQSDLNPRSWTREEMRYMKDTPVITPVSYPNRVAPLPEDRVRPEEEGKTGEGEEENEELKRERRRIENQERWNEMMRRRQLGREEEDDNLPYPTIIKLENNDKKKGKVIYDLKEAIRLVKSNAERKFDETLEAHVKMTPELRRTDLKLSGSLRLPHGFGKTYRVAVFAEGAAADEARDAGADVVGGTELVEGIKNGDIKINFDKCIATPAMMDHVKKLSRNLKQLMPDKKKGTVTNDISEAVKEAKALGVIFKKDKTAIVHVGLGKVSFTEEALRENIGAFVNALLLAKPAGLKKSSKYAGYVDTFHICSTMGPSFPVSIQSLSMAADRYSRLQVR